MTNETINNSIANAVGHYLTANNIPAVEMNILKIVLNNYKGCGLTSKDRSEIVEIVQLATAS